jgi:hypothetical protein
MVRPQLDRSIPVARRNYDMQATVRLPKAFSVRDEHELFPMQHLMARMNPKLMVVQVATGRHVNGGCTVLWGLVYLEGQRLTTEGVEDALTPNFKVGDHVQGIHRSRVEGRATIPDRKRHDRPPGHA